MLTAIIIDDETSSRNALRQKLHNHCTDVMIIAECENGEEGIENIEKKKPDIVFLDVEMPRMNGFTMLQQLKNKNFEVIFVTAYDHYAIKAIRYSALDYLIKPVEIDDLKNEEVILYCRSGNRSGISAMVLDQLGFTNTKNLVGGMLGWQQKFNR